MKLKNIFVTILAAFALLSCDNVALDKRTTEVSTDAFKKPVVVIDFTGVACNNCPAAAELLKTMHDKAGDKIIGVAMYPDCSFNHTEFDLRSVEATQYYEAFGDLSKIVLPSGMVDFSEYNSEFILDKDLWASAVLNRITKEPAIEVLLEQAKIDNNSRQISFETTIKAMSNISNNISVIYWLIEDEIIGTQNYYGTYISDYTHNHVLRKSLNGLWGENVAVGVGSDYKEASSFTIDNSNWKLENCAIVAAIINSDSKEIITANKIEL